MLRSTIGMLAALAAAMLAALFAPAAPLQARGIDASGCAFYAPAGSDPRTIIATPPPPCNKAVERADGRISYVRFDRLGATAERGDPLQFSYRIGRAEFQRVYFRYADGAIVTAREARDDAFRAFADSSLYFTVPWRPVPLATILVEARGFENAHGLAARARLDTRSANAERLEGLRLLYGLFAGAIVAMLAYNLMLWWAMRYRFMLIYCAVGAAMLLFGFSWSGLIQLVLPAATINLQIGINFLSYVLVVAALAAFLFALVEGDILPRWLVRATQGAAALGVAACLLRLAGLDAIWRLLDLVSYASVMAMLGLVLVALGFAIARNSRAVRYFLIAWTVPFLFAVWRTGWGAGLFAADGAWLDVSPFGIMAAEMLLSALGMAARIRDLRVERDDAQAMRAMLQHLADTDSLSGLLNRRAFLERANARRSAQRLILLDIDRFKTVNDRFGHEAGDGVIAEIARLLRAGSPADALVARLGGEEFAVLVDDDDAYDRLAATLLLQIAYAPMPVHVRVTASAGEAIGPAAGDEAWRALFNAADGALYMAKADGGNCVRIGSAPPASAQPSTRRRVAMGTPA